MDKKVKQISKKIDECESKYTSSFEETVNHYPVLSDDEEEEILGLYKKTGDDTYRDIICKCNLRYVFDSCKDESGYREDLISEGTIFLLQFIEKFNKNKALKNFKNILQEGLNKLYKKKTKEAYKATKKVHDEFTQIAVESVRGIREIKTLGLKNKLSNLLSTKIKELIKASNRKNLIYNSFDIAVTVK